MAEKIRVPYVDDEPSFLDLCKVYLERSKDFTCAMALFQDQERICRVLGDDDTHHASLFNQGTVLYQRSDIDGAMALFKEAERICGDLGLDHARDVQRQLPSRQDLRGHADRAARLLHDRAGRAAI
jgi:hypothetical protein